MKQRIVAGLIFIIVIAVGGYIVWGSGSTPADKTVRQSTQKLRGGVRPSDNKTIRLVAAGDMLPHDTVNQAAKTASGYDYTQFFKNVEPGFKDSDIAFCNQESPTAAGLSVSGYPTFNAPPQFSKDLASVGCNLISLANNHAYDRGQAGINGTIDTWSAIPKLGTAGIHKSATDQSKITYFEKKGIKFAFLAYTECSNNASAPSFAVSPLNKNLTDSQIATAKANADMIIVSTHWCKENISQQTAQQDQWAQYFADKGVQIVIGTGPHFLQPVKKLPRTGGGSTIVWFSLGNFLSTQEQINGLIGGFAVMDIDIAKKDVTNISFAPTYMHYEWTAAEKANGDLLKRKNLMLYPLADAADPLAKSQNNTTVEAQTKRVTDLMNQYTQVEIVDL